MNAQWSMSLLANLNEWWFCGSSQITEFKNNTWFTLWLHSLLMTKLSTSIHKLYIHFFNCWCCSSEIVYVLLPPFWGPGMLYCCIPNLVILGKYALTSTIQSQHFFIFFLFYQGLDGADYLEDTAHLVALNVLPNGMNWLYVILVEQTHYICTLLSTGWHSREMFSCSELETIAAHCFFISLLQVSCTVQL